MSDHHFVQAAGSRIGVFDHHIPSGFVIDQGVPLLDKVGEVSQCTVLHHQVNVRACLLAVDESNNVRMMKAFEDVNLRG